MNFPKTIVFLTVFNLTVASEFACAAPATGQPPATQTPPTVAGKPASPVAPTNQAAAVPEDIRDIRGPISIPYGWLWAAYIAGGLALGASAYGGWRWYRRYSKERAKLPHEIALERLAKARELMTPERAREYSFAVSDITRRYIEARFHERAARRTTEEFLRDLLMQSGRPLAAYHEQLQNFMYHCDLAKFARWQLSPPEMEDMHESACAFVRETRPQPAEKVSHRSEPQLSH